MTDSPAAPVVTPWSTIACLTLMTFVLVASEFLPVSLLTPIAHELAITEGQAGQAISFSGLLAVLTSLFGNSLFGRLDRRPMLLVYTAVLVLSGVVVTLAPTYLVFMLGRALLGVSIGGFWSLSAAVVARISRPDDLPRALAGLQIGTALAAVLAAPASAFLGSLIGWRLAFFTVVPIGVVALAWQALVLPRLPAEKATSPRQVFGLLGRPVVAIGMGATTFAFMGQFALATYLRPFLENVTHLDIAALTLVLLSIGGAGLVGSFLIGFVLHRHLTAIMIGLPAALAGLAVLLVTFGSHAMPTVALLFAWGILTTPIPVVWGTWMTRAIPHDLEAGGGLQVALIQLAIMLGAALGGLLYDTAGWWSAFLLGALLLALSSASSALVARSSAAQ